MFTLLCDTSRDVTNMGQDQLCNTGNGNINMLFFACIDINPLMFKLCTIWKTATW